MILGDPFSRTDGSHIPEHAYREYHTHVASPHPPGGLQELPRAPFPWASKE